MSSQSKEAVSRRSFIRRSSFALASLPVMGVGLASSLSCQSGGTAVSSAAQPESPAEPDPKSLSWKTKIVADDEPGVPLVVSGRIFDADGKTPLEDVVLYFYHTDARGFYSDADGNGQEPKPRLKGWLKTAPEGRYEFRTIRPASYPNSRNPAHIHAKVSRSGHAEQWIAEFWFEGDPFIPTEAVERAKASGQFSPVMSIRRGDDGVLHCTRDIKLRSA